MVVSRERGVVSWDSDSRDVACPTGYTSSPTV